jgi:NitT/TauT family transport system permease protein
MTWLSGVRNVVEHGPTRISRRSVPRRLILTRAVAAILPGILFCVVTAFGWAAMSRWLASPLIPGVGEIGTEIVRICRSGLAVHEIAITFWRVLLGVVAAFVVSALVGTLTARNAALARFFQPALVLGLTIPGLVWALLCVIWFGVSLATPVVAIALGIAPALIVQIAQGIESVNADELEMAHVFKFSRWTQLRFIWLPALSPVILAALRLGLSLAWKVIVLVEMFGLSNGVGYQLQSEFSSQNVAGVLAWTLIFWVVMASIDMLAIHPLERHVTRWRRSVRV